MVIKLRYRKVVFSFDMTGQSRPGPTYYYTTFVSFSGYFMRDLYASYYDTFVQPA